MKIDYNKIFPGDLSQYVSPAKLEEIKKEANARRNVILKNKPLSRQSYINQGAKEYAYAYCINQDKTPIEKALLTSNIAIDDEKMARVLENNGFDRSILTNYIRILSYLKSKQYSGDMSSRDKLYEHKADIITQKLTSAVALFCGQLDPEIIINKITELLTYRPELIHEKAELAFASLKNYLLTELHQISSVKYVYYDTGKVNDKDIAKCNFIIHGDNIDPNELIKIASIVEVIRDAFKNKHIALTISINSTKQFTESDNLKYLYKNNTAKVKAR